MWPQKSTYFLNFVQFLYSFTSLHPQREWGNHFPSVRGINQLLTLSEISFTLHILLHLLKVALLLLKLQSPNLLFFQRSRTAFCPMKPPQGIS